MIFFALAIRLIQHVSSECKTPVRKLFFPSFFSCFFQTQCNIANRMNELTNENSIYRTGRLRSEEIDTYSVRKKTTRCLYRMVVAWSEAWYRKYSIWCLCRLRHVRLRWAGNRVYGWCTFDTRMWQNWFSGKPRLHVSI